MVFHDFLIFSGIPKMICPIFPELRVWGRPEFHQALEGVNAKLTTVFQEIAKFWCVALPLRRLDIVALPNYQGVKPADNWGLIVFK